MKRLISLLLALAMLFSVCTIFTACDGSSVSSGDTDEDDDEEEKKAKPTLVFYGLEIVLPKDFEITDESNSYVIFKSDAYQVMIACEPLEDKFEGYSATDLMDYYVDMWDPDSEDSEVGEWETGEKDGTPLYLCDSGR